MKKEVVLTIKGRVQGVFYRREAQTKAIQLGLKGYVKNNPDGSVTAVAQGEQKALQDFIDWCRKGPEEAQVEEVEIHFQPQQENFENFMIVT
jgi:acylphosphatase